MRCMPREMPDIQQGLINEHAYPLGRGGGFVDNKVK
jgi:hypothetical protein